ncbi:hypothetical protein QUA03_02685 [Microcoleus sp. S36b_A4]|uniref:hypothetical protein n=1 Tax=Microcoleus sp. S36b_A4 TaxID=3055420 RepID=UPI002FCF2B5D
MNKKNFLLVLCLLLPSLVIGCKQPQTSQQTSSPFVRTQTTTIPGWKKFEGRGVQLQLPESYSGGDLSQYLDVVVQKLESLGPYYQQVAQSLKQNPSAFVIWAFDSKVSKAGFLSNVAIAIESVGPTVTIDTYLDLIPKQLPSEFRVVEQKKVSLDRYQAGQIVIEATISGVTAKQIIYTIKQGSNMWIVAFSTSAEEFEERKPTFEQSINTFSVSD